MKRKRKRTETPRKRRKGKVRRREGASLKMPLELFLLPRKTLRALSSSLRSAVLTSNSYVRRWFRVIGAITHPVSRWRTKGVAAVTASRYRRANSHSVGGPVYEVTSILRYGMLHRRHISRRDVTSLPPEPLSWRLLPKEFQSHRVLWNMQPDRIRSWQFFILDAYIWFHFPRARNTFTDVFICRR